MSWDGKVLYLDEVTKGLNEAVSRLKCKSVKGLKRAALHVCNEARKKAPRDKGHLRASGHVVFSNNGRRADIIFSQRYAAKQHEDTDLHHTDGEAKYLEKALIANYDRILKEIAEGDDSE